MEMTARWARRSKDYFEAHKHEVPWFAEKARHFGNEQSQALFGIVQGGMYPELRRESAAAHRGDRFSRPRHRRPLGRRAPRKDLGDGEARRFPCFPPTSRAT